MKGIYKITNPEGKVYIGASRNIKERWWYHGSNKKNVTTAIAKSIVHYGKDAHTFEMLHELPEDVTQDILDRYEQVYMDAYINCGIELLNLREAGSSGYKMSNHIKQILIKANTGKNRSDETKRKISDAHIGRIFSEQHIKNFSGINHAYFRIDPAKHPKAKRVKDIITGEVFGSVKQAANKAGLKRPTLSLMLTGYTHNRTNLRYDL